MIGARCSLRSGDDGLTPSKRGPKGKASTESKLELRQPDRSIATLERKLAHAAIIIELQRKVMELAAASAPLNDEASS